MYKGNNVFIQKLLIFINMIILPVLIVLAWHFATSTGAMSTLILPKISTVLETLKEQIINGTLPGRYRHQFKPYCQRLRWQSL
ncbi:MAG: hypothetical protein ACLUD0_20680 [Eubacterium ramulus]